MADKLMYNSNDDTQNYPFGKLILVVEPFEHSTNQNLLKSQKLLDKRIRKRYYKNFATRVINNPLSSLSLWQLVVEAFVHSTLNQPYKTQ